MPTRGVRAWRLAIDRRGRRTVAARVAAALLLAAAAAARGQASPGAGADLQWVPASVRTVDTVLPLSERSLPARWLLPGREPRGFALMQHGYARRCANLDGTLRHWAGAGLLVLCIDVAGAPGANWLPAEVADALLDGSVTPPGGEGLPARIVVAGHSAGALFAAAVGARLNARAPSRLAGAVLFDPVAAAGLAETLAAVSQAGRRPVRAVLAAPGPCNARGNAVPVLRALRDVARAAGVDVHLGVRLGAGSTHVDAEAGDTTAFAVTACGQGWPQRPQVRLLRELGARWAVDMLADARAGGSAAADGPPPGTTGRLSEEALAELVAQTQAQPIE